MDLKTIELINRIDRLQEMEDEADEQLLDDLWEELHDHLEKQLEEITIRITARITAYDVWKECIYDMLVNRIRENPKTSLRSIIEQDINEHPYDYTQMIEDCDIVVE